MKKKMLPPIEVLREALTYNPEDGVLRWKVKPSKRVRVGDEAGTLSTAGYKQICVRGHMCYAHRVAYALYHGTDPYPMDVDHINRDKLDNRIINLRVVSRSENVKNSKRSCVSVRITYCGTNVITIAPSIDAAACALGVCRGTIYKHISNIYGNNAHIRNNDYGCTHVRVERVQ